MGNYFRPRFRPLDDNGSGPFNADDSGTMSSDALSFVLPGWVDVHTATVTFSYNGSDPSEEVDGDMRLWLNNAAMRVKGDYVAPNTPYTMAELTGNGNARSGVLYLESLTGSSGFDDKEISIDVDPQGAGAEGQRILLSRPLTPSELQSMDGSGSTSLQFTALDADLTLANDEIWLNNNDDDNNGVSDLDDASASSDLDLVKLSLSWPTWLASTGAEVRLTLTGNAAGRVKLWRSQSKGTGQLVLDKGESTISWIVGTSPAPSELYVEGVEGSLAMKDLGFSLLFAAPATTSHPAATTQATTQGTAPYIKLMWNGRDISSKFAGDVVVGQEMYIEAQVGPMGKFNNPTHEWRVEGANGSPSASAVANYVVAPDGTSGTVLPLTGQWVQKKDILFYFVYGTRQGQLKTVDYSITAGGVSKSAGTGFSVHAPDATLQLTPTTDNPPVNVGDPGFGGGVSLHFGSFNSPGVTITGNITAPVGGKGQIGVFQTLWEEESWTELNGARWSESIGSATALAADTHIPYADHKETVESNAGATWEDDDSPYTSTRKLKELVIVYRSRRRYVAGNNNGRC